MPESVASEAKFPDLAVFLVRRETTCSDCGCSIGKGGWLRMEHDKPLCLDCADLGHLEFLPSGDAALTRAQASSRRCGPW